VPLVAAESVVRNWLAGHFGAGYRVVTELPAGLGAVVAVTPVIQVTRFGGSDDLLVLDDANIDVDTFDVGRDKARALGELVRSALRFDLPGVSQDGGFVAAVSTINAPRWVPYDNTDLRRFVASYRITVRSIPIEGVP
jgi:hypothetical protein